MGKDVSLRSDGLILVIHEGRNYFFTQITDTESDPRVSEEYADGQDGKIYTKTIAERMLPLTLRKPYEPAVDGQFWSFLTTTSANNRLVQVSEKIGDEVVGEETTVFRDARISKYKREGTDKLSNAARYLEVQVEFDGLD